MKPRLLLLLIPIALVASDWSTEAIAGSFHIRDCSYYGTPAAAFAGGATGRDLTTADECLVTSGGDNSRSLEINTLGSVGYGYSADWVATSPSPALAIIGVYTPLNQVFVDCSITDAGYSAAFFWGNNGQTVGSQSIYPDPSGPDGSLCYGHGINTQIPASQQFGWAVGCFYATNCEQADDNNRLVGVRGIDLEVEENTGPAVAPLGSNNIWNSSSTWIRGIWPASFSASDPSGVCSTALVVGGQVQGGPGDSSPDQSAWQQCPSQQMNAQVDTTQHANGPLTIQLEATNAAGVTSAPAETVHVDNAPVELSLSGSHDVPATSRTGYVTATASDGPSGISSIGCSVDGGATTYYHASTANIGVQGIGVHQVSCTAYGNAIDSSGKQATSAPQTWELAIRKPAVASVAFGRRSALVRCVRRREKIHVAGHWITERVHGHRVRVHVPAQTRSIRVRVCRPRHRSGGAAHAVKRVGHGKSATVSGWVGAFDGTALSNARVEVQTAPDNGKQDFTTVGTVQTSPDGTWIAKLPPGPGRLVRVYFPGSATVEPVYSPVARLVVPARVTLAIRPPSTHWGGTIHIVGRLRGGYVPPSGEVVVLWIGWRSGSTEIGHLYARDKGIFRSTYTFLRGYGRARYHLWAVTAAESDYPFSPARSRAVGVTVGS